MPSVDLLIETEISQSVRARQVQASFDVPERKRDALRWQLDFPIEAKPWGVGLIVGPSGSGKTSIMRHVFGDPKPQTWGAASVLDDFAPTLTVAAITEALVEAAKGFKAIFHTAGLLGTNGDRGWLLAELPRVLRVKGDESEIRPYLLGCAAHDGHHGVVLKNVATRVVCQNTLGVAMGEDSRFNVAVRHTSDAQRRFESATRAFHLLLDGMDEFEKIANLLAETSFSDRQMARTIDDLLPLPKDEEGNAREAGKQLNEKRERVQTLFTDGLGITAGIRGTAWAALQAWTEFNDHHRAVRNDADGSKRLESIWLGRAADLKTDALKSITAAMTQGVA